MKLSQGRARPTSQGSLSAAVTERAAGVPCTYVNLICAGLNNLEPPANPMYVLVKSHPQTISLICTEYVRRDDGQSTRKNESVIISTKGKRVSRAAAKQI